MRARTAIAPATKERPFNATAEEVRAFLDGTKTQARRIAKLHAGDEHDLAHAAKVLCPYGAPGRLWVREAFCVLPASAGCEKRAPDDYEGVRYRATWDRSHHAPWKPSLRMPRWASRLTLAVKAVRVERLHDISEEDALAEGMTGSPVETPREQFADLWRRINGAESWQVNPWVWVLTLSRVAK